MSNDQRPPQQQPVKPAGLTPIRVLELKFDEEKPTMFQGESMTRRIASGKKSGRESTGHTIEITLEPWARRFRVRELDPKGKLVVQFFVPETWAAYTTDEDV